MGELKQKYIQKQRDLSNLSVRPEFPRIIKIDICNVCNYACVFCPQAKQINKRGNIEDVLCKRIIVDAFEAGARELCLSSTGEPLLNPKLADYIELAKNIGYEYIFFNTNGFLLNENNSKEFLTKGIDSIKFSVNSTEKSYKIIHGGGSYEAVKNNLMLFFRLRESMNSPCRIYVSYVSTKYTEDEAEIVKKELAPYCDDIIVMKANNRGGVADEVDRELYSGNDEYSYQYPCSQIFNNVYVTAEGYLVACCQDFDNNMVIENLNEVSIKDAWNGENFVRFRERFLNRDFEGLLCANCLNNKHDSIVPLREEYAGYEVSPQKKENLLHRIEKLKMLDKT